MNTRSTPVWGTSRRAFLKGIGVGATLLAAAGVAAAEPVDSPRVIDSPGTYDLTTDITHRASTPCIEIRADGVVFNGNGHTIQGGRIGTGVLVTGSNVTVENLTTTNLRKGVEVLDSQFCELRDVTSTNNSGNGLLLTDSTHCQITECTVESNKYDGIELENANDNEVTDNTVKDNADGIELESANDNTITGNVVCGNRDSQINFDAQSSGNTIADNNTTCAPVLTSRWFTDCVRITEPGEYNIGGNIDHTGGGTCIEIVGDDVTLHGRHRKVEGQRDGVALRISGNNVTVENFIATHVRNGIVLEGATNCEIRGCYVEKCVGDAVELTDSHDNLIVDNGLWENDWDALELNSSNDNEIRGNTISRNGDEGIELFNSTGNSFVDNFICDNAGGPFNGSRTGNTLTNNVTDCTIDTPKRLTTPGIYRVTADIFHGGSGPCLEIVADDIVVDGQGHTITGQRQGHGIVIRGDNVVVKNLNTDNVRIGALFSNTSNSVLRDATVANGSGDGVAINGGSGNTVVDCLIRGNKYDGIEVEDTSGTKLRRNVLENNADGIEIERSSNTVLIDNVFCGNRNNRLQTDGQSSGITEYQSTTDCSNIPGRLKLVRVKSDDQTPDNTNMDDEYLVFENSGDGPVNLTGYVIDYGKPAPTSNRETTYQFPSGYTLGPGDTVTVRTGNGADGGGELWVDSGSPALFNYGGIVRVYDDNGMEMIEQQYTWQTE